MYRKFLLVLLSAAVLTSCVADEAEQTLTPQPSAPDVFAGNTVAGRVRIKFREGAVPCQIEVSRSGGVRTGMEQLDARAEALGVTQMRRVFPPAGRFEARTRKAGLDRWYDVWYEGNCPVTRAATDLSQLEDVECAEPVYKIERVGWGSAVAIAPKGMQRSDTATAYPVDDPMLPKQWHYMNDGSLPDAVAGADINLFRAWEVTAGRNDVVVAVVDGGIDYEHEDLAGNVGNWAELHGEDGVDDDGNGYVDDIYGWNFIYTDKNPYGSNRITPVEHGTHVAGTIGAENNNGKGVCGIAGGQGNHSGVRMISCQMFTENKNDNGDEVVALKYGADAGAVISQNSWGYSNMYELPQITKDAIEYFIENAGVDENGVQTGPMRGGIVIFAAGNDERDYKSYPACYEKVLSVAALAPDYRRSYYSNFSDWVDVAAPGGTYEYMHRYSDDCAVLSTLPGNQYGYMQGTSMACPHVSGVAALAVSQYGGEGFTPDKLWAYLVRGTHEVDTYNPNYKGRLGSGLVDAYLAVSMDKGIRPDAVADLTHTNTAGEVELSWSVPADGDDGHADSFILMWRVGTLDNPNPEALPEGAHKVVIPVRNMKAGDHISYVLTDIAEQTHYTVAIIAVDPWNNRSDTTVISFGTPANTPPALVREGATDVAVAYNTVQTVTFRIDDPDSVLFTYELQDDSGAITVRKEEKRLCFDIFNYKRKAGTYTARITVSDNFGASDSAEFAYTLLPDKAPVPTDALVPVYLGSLGDTADFAPADGFTDEVKETVKYTLEYDRDRLYLQPVADRYRIMPLCYGRSEVTVVATDEGGNVGRNTFAVVCRNESRSEIDLYPNPVKERLTIAMGRDVEGVLRVEIFDSAGRRVFVRSTSIAPTAPATLDLSALGGGTYSVQVEYEGRKWIRNIVKL